jgi:hypothetical protein
MDDMHSEFCPFEKDVFNAVVADLWTDELRAHVSGCPGCSATVLCTRGLRELASEMSGESPLPVSFGVIWARALCREKQIRLSRLDLLFVSGSLGITLAGLAGAAIWKWDVVKGWIAGSFLISGSSLPLYALIGSAALVWFLTEEAFFSDK